MTGENLIDRFLAFLENEKRLAPRTMKDYRIGLAILGPILEMRAYREIADAIIAMKEKRNWADPTAYKLVIKASEFFGWACREGHIEKNPFANGHHFKKNIKHRIEFFDWDDPAFKKLFNDPHMTIRIKCILHVLKSSGVRASELCNLKTRNVKGRWLEIEQGKTGDRSAPIDEETRYWLSVYIECLKEHYQGEWLFPREDYSGPMTTSNLGKMLTRMGHKAGMKIYPHKFRHSLAGALIKRGADLAICAEVLGHKSISTTKIYTHFQKADILTKYDDALKSN